MTDIGADNFVRPQRKSIGMGQLKQPNCRATHQAIESRDVDSLRSKLRLACR